MLDENIQNRLEKIKDIPSIPSIAAIVIDIMGNPDLGTNEIVKVIDKDQSLAMRILRLANSPIYGFSKQVTTTDLAAIVLGKDNLKEIVMTYILQGFFSSVNVDVFNSTKFWEDSLLTACAARIVGRKLKYKLVNEAFIAGLIHDIGIRLIAEFFTDEYIEIHNRLAEGGKSIIEVEEEVLGTNHAMIGYWLANKWNFPDELCNAIRHHHSHFSLVDTKTLQDSPYSYQTFSFNSIKSPLTAIVSIAEWLVYNMKEYNNFIGTVKPTYYLAEELFSDISNDDYLNPKSRINLILQDISTEYNIIASELPLQ